MSFTIVIRAHDYPAAVLDSWQAVRRLCPDSRVLIAVDANEGLARQLQAFGIPPSTIMVSEHHWGWGIGLFCMLLETIMWCNHTDHLVSLDYDSLIIAKGLEERLNGLIKGNTGLLGVRRKDNPRCRDILRLERTFFQDRFFTIPDDYCYGEDIQGGCFCLTSQMIVAMKVHHVFAPPYTKAHRFTKLTDDYFLPLLCRHLRLDVVDTSAFMDCQWKAVRSPCGLEREGIIAIHPVKYSSNPLGTGELAVRNYFREQRGEADQLK